MLNVNVSLNQILLTFCSSETNLDDSINSSYFSVRGLSSFNLKRFYYSCAWSCSFCERRSSFCTGPVSRKLCGFLLTFWTGFASLSVLLLFNLSIAFFVVISSIIKTGFPILVELTDLVNSYNFSVSNDLTQVVNARIPDCDSHSPALLDLFISSNASICFTMAFPPM